MLKQSKIDEEVAVLKSAVAQAAMDENFEEAISLRKKRDALLAEGATEEEQQRWRAEVSGPEGGVASVSTMTVDDMAAELTSSGQFAEAATKFESEFAAPMREVSGWVGFWNGLGLGLHVLHACMHAASWVK